jgi:hypothetical protein
MADKVFYVSEGTGWHERKINPTEGTAWHERTVKVTNGTAWYLNYPRATYQTKNFDCTWTQSYMGDGTPLYNGTFWLDDLVVGDDENMRALIGFNKNDIQAHITGGQVTSVKLLINLKETSLNGLPDVYFGKYSYGSEPATYTGQGDWGDQKHRQFPNRAYGGYWVDLNPTQATLADGVTAISCICMKAATANVEDMARFNGKVLGGYNSILQVTVYK